MSGFDFTPGPGTYRDELNEIEARDDDLELIRPDRREQRNIALGREHWPFPPSGILYREEFFKSQPGSTSCPGESGSGVSRRADLSPPDGSAESSREAA